MKVFGRDYIKTDVARGVKSGSLCSSEPSQYEYQLSKASKDDIVVGKVTINRRDQVKYWGTNFHGDITRHYKINGETQSYHVIRGGETCQRFLAYAHVGLIGSHMAMGGAIRTIDCPTCQLTVN
jgi:hypothetical protein